MRINGFGIIAAVAGATSTLSEGANCGVNCCEEDKVHQSSRRIPARAGASVSALSCSFLLR